MHDSSQYMPWFSIIANYTTSIKVPEGVLNQTFNAPDIAGVGMPSGVGNSFIYNLNTGGITQTTSRSIDWSTLQAQDNIDTSTPFVLTGLPTSSGRGSAVATVSNVYLPDNTRLFDAYTVINAYGGEDGAIVQVKSNSTGTWTTIFTSFGYTQRNDGGYGNVPGILNIAPYITAGNNQVRVITWDNANTQTNDYDLVGLTNCYSTITYSALPIRWDTFAFNSMQYSTSTGSQPQNFNIAPDAQEALLFLGLGTDSRNITVTCKKQGSSTTSTLYTGSVPYDLDLGYLDSQKSTHIITNVSSDGSYQLVPGNYTLTVSVTAGKAYESGDFGGSSQPSGSVSQSTYANPEIYSGTRIGIIYPKFLQNAWSSGFASTADEAKNNANDTLQGILDKYVPPISYDRNKIKTEAIFTGGTPDSVSVRLELWKQ